MDYDVVIANGTVLTADGATPADVAIQGETIAAVDPGLAVRHAPAARSSMRPAAR